MRLPWIATPPSAARDDAVKLAQRYCMLLTVPLFDEARFRRGAASAAASCTTAHGWPFGWRLTVVPGTGHNARATFTSDQAFAALRP